MDATIVGSKYISIEMMFNFDDRLTAIPKVRVTDRESSLQHDFDFCFDPFPMPCDVDYGGPEQRFNLE